MRYLIYYCLLIWSTGAQAQTDKLHFQVDSTIKTMVDQQIHSDQYVASAYMEIRMFVQDSLIFDSEKKGKKIECLTMTSIQGDTIHVIGFIGMFVGFGFYLDLFKDSCTITHLAKSDMEVYKLHPADTILDYSLSVPCVTKSLVLVNKPAYREGEVLEGILELSSADYWEVSNGKTEKYRMEMKTYFKTEGAKREK